MRVVIPSEIYDYFVGNKGNHIIFNDGVWKRSFMPITKNLILKHVRFQIAIGSYPIYIENGTPYCKWICIDVDSHKRVPKKVRDEVREEYDDKTAKLILKKLEKEYSKKVDVAVKAKQLYYVDEIYRHSEHHLGIPIDNVALEDSGGGYHIWIFLKEHTTLEDVGKWVYKFRPQLDHVYRALVGDEEMPEIYPKQYTTEHLSKSLGNAVRLPYGYNFNKKHHSKILFVPEYICITQIRKKLNLHELVKDIVVDLTKLNGIHATRKKVEVYKSQDMPVSLDFYMELPIRPCLKMIINGETQCFGSHGHYMRMALVHELRYVKMPLHIMVDCFKQQYDFDDNITLAQIESVLNSTRKKDGRYSCGKIAQLGYCHGCDRK